MTFGSESTTADIWPLVEVLPSGTVDSTSPAFASCLGRTVSELTGVAFCDLVHPEDLPLATALLRTGPDRARELRFITAAGEERFLVVGPYPLKKATSLILLCCDVTEQRRAESAARADARRYTELVRSASDWVWELDAELRYTYFSPNLEQITSIPPASIIGKRRDEIPGSTVAPEQWADHLATLRSQKPFRDFIYRSTPPGGRHFWIKTSGTPIFTPDGRFVGYRGVASDVTAQVTAERATAESEKRLLELFEVASDWFWETDADHRFTFLSSAWSRLTGQSPERFLGKRRDEFGDRAIDPEAWHDHLAVLEARKPFRNFTYSLRSGAGALQWIRTTGIPVFDEEGHFKGYRGSATDVTAEMDSSRRAQATYQLFAEVVESVPASLMVHDVDDRLVICNSVTHGFFPRTGHLLVPGSKFEDFARAQAETGEVPEARGREEEWFRERMRKHRLPENNITRQYADGRWIQINERRMSDGSTIGIRLDITELKKAEAQRLRLVEQLQHSQKLELIGTLAGGIAHELNNALVPVLALAKLTIKLLPEGSREHRNLATIRDAAERARDLVKNILAFSRKETPTRISVDLAASVGRSLDLLRPVIPSTIRIEERIGIVPLLLADPDGLHQLLVNLIANAAQAIGDHHGTIFIELAAVPDTQRPQGSLSPSSDLIRLSVSDTGCGMDEATIKHIFDPFFTSKPVGEGTGLGLSTVHGIVAQLGGRIAVESRVGQGTRFDILLPLLGQQVGPIATVTAAERCRHPMS